MLPVRFKLYDLPDEYCQGVRRGDYILKNSFERKILDQLGNVGQLALEVSASSYSTRNSRSQLCVKVIEKISRLHNKSDSHVAKPANCNLQTWESEIYYCER